MSEPPIDNSSPAQQPGSAEVAAELARILDSRSFEQAGRASEFLRYVVEQTLAGAADRLKGYSIAVEVFKRPPNFDAQSDPLVRVEAGRLRRRLAEYYAAEGRDNPVRIKLPRGGYAPEFVIHSATQAPVRATSPSRPMLRRGNLVVAATVAAVIVVAAAALALRFVTHPVTDALPASAAEIGALAMPRGPSVIVVPFENLSGDPSLGYVADGVTEEIRLHLSAFDLFVIASPGPGGGDAENAEKAAQYILSGSVRMTPESVRITATLVDRNTLGQVWAAAYDEALDAPTLIATQQKIAAEVAQTIARPYGPIFERELARTVHKAPENFDTYDCVLRYYAYRRELDRTLHAPTVACFQKAVSQEPQFADAWAGLALLYLDEYAYGYTPQSMPASALDRAGEAARSALDIDGRSSLASLALARVRYFSGDLPGFQRSVDRVLSLDPNNGEALVVLGALLALSGSSERAQALVERAAKLSQHLPSVYYLAHALVDLREGRNDAALSAALQVDAPNWFVAPLIVGAAAGLSGRSDVASRAVTRLLELYPDFPERSSSELAKWQIEPQLLERIRSGLAAAGLEID
jgi:adenylate cyclase